MNNQDYTDRRATYWQKLKDPRWQKRRLEIFNRDDWTCQKCRGKEITLNVHHNFYLAGKEPWDYPDHCLVTLCEPCHEIETNHRPGEEKRIIEILREAGLHCLDLSFLADFLGWAYGQNSRCDKDTKFAVQRALVQISEAKAEGKSLKGWKWHPGEQDGPHV
jgi:hypothetical protein